MERYYIDIVFEYGYFNIIVRDYMRDQFGDAEWAQVLAQLADDGIFIEKKELNDIKTKRLLEACINHSGFTKDRLLKNIGEHYFNFINKSKHHEMLSTLGENLGAFLDNLDYLHSCQNKTFPSMRMPHFRCDRDPSGDITKLHYYSVREGMYPIVIGILKAASRTYFKKSLGLRVESITHEEIGSDTIFEHVTFAVTCVDYNSSSGDAPPTLVAETRKHAERQILKDDVERVAERLDEIKREHGEEALPLNKARATQAKWKALAKISMLRKGFGLNFPAHLKIDSRTFCHAFPYHVVFDRDMQVVHCGVKIQQMLPSSKQSGCRLELVLDLVFPRTIKFSYTAVCSVINAPFVLQMRKSKLALTWKQRTPLLLKGQMLVGQEGGYLVFLCSPYVHSLQDLHEHKLYISDIAMFDVTRSLLHGSGAHRTTAHGSSFDTGFHSGHTSSSHKPGNILVVGSGLQRSPNLNNRGNALMPYGTGNGTGNQDDLRELKRELRRVNAELAAEKERTRQMYVALMPPYLADQALSGRLPDSGVYENVSVLFCDVVAFSKIMETCDVSEALNLLNHLHTVLLHACRVHNSHRVNSIGDAFLAVSGVPVWRATGTVDIANTALAMLQLAQQVSSPFDYGDRSKSVKIRIGLDIGRVLSGVIGEEIPRYLVIGEAVNTACKLESHGVPDQIHMSEAMYAQLKRKPFRIEKRGNIEIRGMGRPKTYILVANEALTTEELVGSNPPMVRSDTMETTFSNGPQQQRHISSPLDQRGRLHGVSASSSGSASPLVPRNKVKPLSP